MASRRRVETAKRRARGRKTTRGSRWSSILRALARWQTLGIVLVLAGVLTAISLLSGEEGVLTAWWLHQLRAGFGGIAYVAPFVFGVSGFWLVLRTVKPDTIAWRPLLGPWLIFVALLPLGHLLGGRPDASSAARGAGAGVVGRAIGEGLAAFLGPTVAVLVALVGLCAALLWISPVTWAQLVAGLRAMWGAARARWDAARSGVNPQLPLPTGELPWYRELGDRLRGWWERRPSPPIIPSLVEPEEPRSPSATRAARPVPPPEATRPGPPLLPARVIGGAQEWRLPDIAEILDETADIEISGEEIRRRARIIEETLASFGVPVKVVEANQGPAVTQFGLQPGYIERKTKDGRVKQVKVKVSRIQALANDLALALSASPIRIEAPVPGRPIVGVEVPNAQMSMVSLRGLLESEEFRSLKGPLRIALGRDVAGQAVVADLSTMPHLLIAGATGSGKSVCINAIIATLLCTHTPDTLRFLMIDPKRVELTGYNGIPHLIAPVITEIDQVVGSLQWATREMERRYKVFSKAGARNIEIYNQILRERGEPVLPYIIVVIDELADLMMASPEEVEQTICRLAQMARATGIHLIIATQRPSVDVVTGLIKANFPARIAFAVVSQIDSRVILDTPGAERLLGRGDMLFMRPDSSKLERLQGAFVSDRELERLVRYWKGIRVFEGTYDSDAVGVRGLATAPQVEVGEVVQQPLWEEMIERERRASQRDDLYEKALEIVQQSDRASVSLLQRRLRIGYTRAARLIDMLEEEGIIGPDEGGSRGRKVLVRSDRDSHRDEDGEERPHVWH